MQIDSIKKRYLFKLGGGACGALLSIIIAGLVPRALGPSHYGDFGFLQSSFLNIIAIITMGSPMAFFAYNAKNRNSYPIIVFYGYFIVAASLITFVLVLTAHNTPIGSFLWPGQKFRYILMAAFLGIITWLAAITIDFADSKGLTVRAAIIKVINKFFATILLITLFCIGMLNLGTYFVFLYFTLFTLISLLIVYFRRAKAIGEIMPVKKHQLADLFKYFYRYCSPLFIYGIFGTLVAYFYRWFLQIIYGSTEQGFFTLGHQLSAVVLLFTASFMPIFMREMASAHGRNDFESMRRLFGKFAKLLFSLTAFLSMIFIFHSRLIIDIFAGDKYIESFWPVTIMFLYPIVQTTGQLAGNVFYSTEQTKLYTNIGYFNNVMGFFIVYFLLAPKNAFIGGFALGAIGLALATVLAGFLTTNVMYYFACRYLRLKYLKFLFHQFIIICSLSFLMFSSQHIIHMLININGIKMQILSLIASSLLYVTFAFGMFYFFPSLLGMNKAEIESNMNKIKNWIQSIKV